MDRKCLSGTSKRKYAQISIKRREGLVESIQAKGVTISKAAKRFNIKLSTAKLIWKKFKETGKFYPKKGRKDQEQHAQISQSSLDGLQNDISLQKNEEELDLRIFEDNQHFTGQQCQEPPFFYEPICQCYWFFPLYPFYHDFQSF